MADNQHRYGFRWATSYNGGPCPKPIEMAVADAYQAQDDGSGFSVDLNVGDPVKLVNDGTVALANTTQAVFGIIVGIKQYYDSSVGAVVTGKKLPGGSTGGGIIARQSRVLVVPAKLGFWEIDVDDSSTATTYAAYQALISEHTTHTCVGVQATKKADPRIDISVNDPTDVDLVWRIMGVSGTMWNRDFSGANVKIIVAVHNSQEPGSTLASGLSAGV